MPFEDYIYLLYRPDYKQEYTEKLALFNIFEKDASLIVENIIPASYIPFLHDNFDKNTEILLKDYNINDDDYIKLYTDLNKSTPENINLAKKRFKNNLNNSVKNLDQPKKCYNTFKIDNLIYVCIISWIFILCLGLNVIYYYYKDYYTYILILATIIILGIAVIFKMISTIYQ